MFPFFQNQNFQNWYQIMLCFYHLMLKCCQTIIKLFLEVIYVVLCTKIIKGIVPN